MKKLLDNWPIAIAVLITTGMIFMAYMLSPKSMINTALLVAGAVLTLVVIVIAIVLIYKFVNWVEKRHGIQWAIVALIVPILAFMLLLGAIMDPH